MNELELIDIVEELNDHLYSKLEPDEIEDVFLYTTEGHTHAISYGEIILWDSEDHGPFDSKELLSECIKSRFNQIVESFKKLEFY